GLPYYHVHRAVRPGAHRGLDRPVAGNDGRSVAEDRPSASAVHGPDRARLRAAGPARLSRRTTKNAEAPGRKLRRFFVLGESSSLAPSVNRKARIRRSWRCPPDNPTANAFVITARYDQSRIGIRVMRRLCPRRSLSPP